VILTFAGWQEKKRKG